MNPILPTYYPQFLTELKISIQQTQVRAVLAVNSEVVRLYWHVGYRVYGRSSSGAGEPR